DPVHRTQLAPPPFPIIPQPIWNVPYHRNLNFTGRETLLEQLRQALTSGQPAALTQVASISGLGGAGKTQLAVEYAYRHATEYDVVWWVRAEKLETMAADYASFAEVKGLSLRDVKEQEIIVHAVRHWFGSNGRW